MKKTNTEIIIQIIFDQILIGLCKKCAQALGDVMLMDCFSDSLKVPYFIAIISI